MWGMVIWLYGYMSVLYGYMATGLNCLNNSIFDIRELCG